MEAVLGGSVGYQWSTGMTADRHAEGVLSLNLTLLPGSDNLHCWGQIAGGGIPILGETADIGKILRGESSTGSDDLVASCANDPYCSIG